MLNRITLDTHSPGRHRRARLAYIHCALYAQASLEASRLTGPCNPRLWPGVDNPYVAGLVDRILVFIRCFDTVDGCAPSAEVDSALDTHHPSMVSKSQQAPCWCEDCYASRY